MRLAGKVTWEELAARGILATDIKQLIHHPDGSTEIGFVDPARELAAMQEQAIVSDEILIKGKLALKNWTSLNAVQKDAILKNLLREYLLRLGAV